MAGENDSNDHETEHAAPGAGGSPEALNDDFPDDGPADDPDAVDAAAADPRVAILAAENVDLKERLLRALADVENMRKRTERQLADAHKYAVTNFARDMLNVADNLARALEAVPEDRRGEDDLVQTLLGGVEAVERELMKVMAAHNIEKIDPEGEPFDPNMHEALFELPGSEHPDGTVAQVMQPGYRLHDRLLRPARVAVAKGGQPAESRVDTKV